MYQIVITYSVNGLQLTQHIIQARLLKPSSHANVMAFREDIGKFQSVIRYFCVQDFLKLSQKWRSVLFALIHKILETRW